MHCYGNGAQFSSICLLMHSGTSQILEKLLCIVYRRSKGVTPCRVNERLLCICICARGWRASPGSEARRAERWANLYKIASIRRFSRTDRGRRVTHSAPARCSPRVPPRSGSGGLNSDCESGVVFLGTKSSFHPPTITKVLFSTLNYKIG